jgi:hypothetical protein
VEFLVVNDIVGAMFQSKFVEELFRPQELYPKKAVKHIFEKLAHSSIMRLNEASMDKVCQPGCLSRCTYMFIDRNAIELFDFLPEGHNKRSISWKGNFS